MDIEIFAPGTWNGDTFTRADIEDMARNFNELKGKIKPPIKLGHRTLEGQPALGWVEGLKVLGEKLVATVVDMPPIILEAIKRKLYRRVSPEIYFGYKDTETKKRYNFVVSAVSLLGADIPAVKSLEDLTAFLSEMKPEAERLMSYEFQFNEDLHIADKGGPSKMDEKEFAEKLKVEENAKKAAEATALAEKTAREAAEAELKAFKEEKEKKELETKLASVRTFCEDQVRGGKMTPALRDQLFPKDKETVVVFTAAGEPVIPFDILKAYTEGIRVVEFGEKGSAASGDEHKDEEGLAPGVILDARAKKFIAEKKAQTYSEAFKMALTADPELAKLYSTGPVKKD
jgi:hypothetical protein